MSTTDALVNQCAHLSLTDTAQLYGSDEALPVIQINNSLCEASVSLYGAHVLSFIPTGHNNLLWLSPSSKFAQGTAIRGGIPVCFPWFAVNQDEPHKPKHGYVRQRFWTLEAANELSDGGTQLTLTYTSLPEDKALFEGEFIVKLHLTFADTLTAKLDVTNTGHTSYPIRWALHSYFAISDVSNVSVTGLEGVSYRDNTQELAISQQDGGVVFDGEVDKAFFDAPTQQVIVDNNQALISVTGDNAPSAIVWNPGAQNAANIADIGAQASTGYVCVERGCAFSDVWVLNPGEQQVGTKIIAPAK